MSIIEILDIVNKNNEVIGSAATVALTTSGMLTTVGCSFVAIFFISLPNLWGSFVYLDKALSGGGFYKLPIPTT